MIKKLFGYIIIVLILIFSFNLEIKADSIGGFNSIYHINNLTVSSGVMHFEGFAFIDHMDNYGGHNLNAYIIAKYENGVQIGDAIPVKYSNVNSTDYFYARCQGDGCNTIPTSNPTRNSKDCNQSTYSDCKYNNVDFTVDVNLNNIIAASDKKSNILLYIVIENTAHNVSSGYLSLGVHANNCTTCSGSVVVGDNVVKFLGIGNRVTVTPTAGNKRYYPSFGDSGVNWSQNSYDVQLYKSNQDITVGAKSFKSNYYVVNDGVSQYILYDSWVQMEKGIVISFGDSIVEKVPEQCKNTHPDNNVSRNGNCNGEATTFKGCVGQDFNINVSYVLNSEQRTKAGDCDLGDLSVNVKAKALLYQEGEFKFGIINNDMYAGRKFEFPAIDYSNRIYWNFAKDINTADIWYDADTVILPEYKEVTTTVPDTIHTPRDCRENEVPGYAGRCYDSTTVTTTTTVSQCVPYEYEIKLTDIVKNSDDSDVALKTKLKEEGKNKVNHFFENSKEIISNVIPTSYDSNEVSYSPKNVDGTWEGEGDGISPLTTLKFGIENKKNSKYEYKIFDSYVKVVEGVGKNDIGDVVYGNPNSEEYQYIGPYYFIPKLFPDGEEFPVNIPNSNISFIKGIIWNYKGICNTKKVTNKIYDCDDFGKNCTSKFYYRPIDLETPFPDGNVPANWIGYNLSRLKQTYDNGFFYKIVLVNGASDNSPKDGIKKLGRNDSELGNVDYNDWTNIDRNGINSFINDLKTKGYFEVNNKRKGEDSWCATGYFDSGCDGYEKNRK